MAETSSNSDRCACDVALKNRLGQACNEEAFRHFLAMERKRSQRSGRAFLLLLVHWNRRRMLGSHMDSTIAAKLFACLWLCLRESDQVGWFREGRVVGALLVDLTDTSVAAAVCEKVRGSLRAGLPPDVASHLAVRAFRLPLRRSGLR